MIKKDYYYKKAKREKYRSRAAYKLKQLNRKFRLVKKGDIVLDLGAAPGGWMQVLREIVSGRGLVIGADLSYIRPLNFENVKTIKGDFTSSEVIGKIKDAVPRADVVVSDASPDISGIWDLDTFRSVELTRGALSIAKDILKPRGNFLVKIFQGKETDEFFGDVKKTFRHAKRTKPKASREKSSEIYITAKSFQK
ncbi:MAG: SAM-dependent methyltransferase [Candidatus Hydrothermarchaeaceae archaeon]